MTLKKDFCHRSKFILSSLAYYVYKVLQTSSFSGFGSENVIVGGDFSSFVKTLVKSRFKELLSDTSLIGIKTFLFTYLKS